MSKSSLRRHSVTLFVAFAAVCIFPTAGFAQTKQGTGFTVSPAQLNMTVGQAKPQQTASVQITNQYATPLTLLAELHGIDESSARLIPTGNVDSTFAQSIALSATQITVAPHGTAQLGVTVTNTSALQPGGHYATIVLTQAADASAIPAFRPAVAVALFVIKSDGVRTNLQLTGIHASHTLFTLPSSVTLDFNNAGNTHVVPRASAGVYDTSLEALYSKAVFNSNSVPLFPNNHVSYTERMTSYGRVLLPKRLQLRVTYRIDGSDIQLVQVKNFWYVPIIDAITLIGLGLLLFWQRIRVRKIARWLWRVAKAFGRLLRKPFRMVSARSATKRATQERRKKQLGTTAVRTHQDATRKAIRRKASNTFGNALVQKEEPTPKRIAVLEKPNDMKVKPKSAKTSIKAKASAKPAPKKATKSTKTTKKNTSKTAKKPTARTKSK